MRLRDIVSYAIKELNHQLCLYDDVVASGSILTELLHFAIEETFLSALEGPSCERGCWRGCIARLCEGDERRQHGCSV